VNWLIAKYLISAAMVVLISELAKRTDKFGALLAALPLVTMLALIWLHVENQPAEKIADQAWYTFWYVIPTLPMLLVFPFMLPRLGFWLTMLAGIAMTSICLIAWAYALRRFGIELI